MLTLHPTKGSINIYYVNRRLHNIYPIEYRDNLVVFCIIVIVLSNWHEVNEFSFFD